MKKIMTLTIALTAVIFLSPVTKAQWTQDTVISTGNYTSGIAVTPDGSKIIITNNTDPGEVKIISALDYSITTIDISSIENYPNAVAVNDSVAIVNTTHKTIFINLFDHAIIGNVPAPCAATTLYGICLTPDGKTAVYPDLSHGCTQQGVRLLNADGKSPVSSFIQVNTSGELYGIGITPDGASAILTTFSSDSPKLVNLQTSSVQNITGISYGSYGIAMFHHSNNAVVFDGDSVDLVSIDSKSIIKKIAALSYNTNFQNIAVTADDKYAVAAGAFETLILSLAGDSVIQVLPSGGTNVASNSDGSLFFVTDSYNGTVQVYKRQNINGIREENNVAPNAFILRQNYPNPFNPSTVIRYTIPQREFVSLKIYDLLGHPVATLVNEEKSAGTYEVQFNSQDASRLQPSTNRRLSSGVYFYKIQAGNYVAIKKMVILK